LFEQGRRARLTPLAQMLLPIFNELLTTHDRTLNDARQLAQAERGSVSLAVVPVLAEEWLPLFLIDLVRDYPHLRVRATDNRSPLVRSLVADGTVAIDVFGILCSPSHRLASRRRAVPWSALRGERLIGNDTFELLKARGLSEWISDPEMVVTSRAALMACVKAELGITPVPMLTRAEKALGLVFMPLTQPRITRTIGIVTRRGQTLLPSVAQVQARILRSLAEYAREQGATLVGSGRGAQRAARPKRN
jgi:DNA-binding transcriptional LysR family regulator